MSFLDEYFFNPILANGWFNPINTLVYSIILVIAVYFVFRLLKRMKIRIDTSFTISILPFIVWAASTRVLHDAAVANALPPAINEFYSLPIFPTPGSYFITFTLALATLLISLVLQRYKNIPYYRTMTSLGVVYCIINFIILPLPNPYPLLLIGGITALWALLFSLPRLLIKGPGKQRENLPHKTKGRRQQTTTVPFAMKLRNLFSWENDLILSAHFLDATATVVSLMLFGYVEQHVVPRMLFPYMGPYAMFFLKAAVVIPVLWLLDRHKADDPRSAEFIHFLKTVVLILGLAPGLRDTLRLMAGV